MAKRKIIIELEDLGISYKEYNKMTIFTSILFCEKCLNRNSPDLTDTALIYTNRFRYLRLENNFNIVKPLSYGFTPHIIILKEDWISYVICDSTCGICGFKKSSYNFSNYGSKVLRVYRDSIDEHVLLLSKWNLIFNSKLLRI